MFKKVRYIFVLSLSLVASMQPMGHLKGKHVSKAFMMAQKRGYYLKSISSFSEVRSYFKNCTEDDMALFDVDDTLIASTDFLARDYLSGWRKDKVLKMFPCLKKPEVWHEVWSLIWQQGERKVIEPRIIDTLECLKKKGTLVLGLTAMETGRYGAINDTTEWRTRILKTMGVTFSSYYPNYVFQELPSTYNNYPELRNGMLCTNQRPKGEVLAAFLKSHDVHPQNVLFFDDRIHYLESVGRFCDAKYIPCNLFLYEGAKKFEKEPLDMECIMKQLEFLLKHKKWISDEDIEKHIL